MTNRSNAAASSSEDLRSDSNTPPPPPSLLEKITTAATSRGNASRANNGLNHTTRVSCTIPLLTEDQSTHDAVMDIIRKKKMTEIATMQAARLKKQQQLEDMQHDKNKDKQRARKHSRDKASSQVEKGMEHLNELESDKTNLEKNIMAEWRGKIVEYEKQISETQKRDLDALKLEHDGVVEKMRNDIAEENNADKLKLMEALNDVGNEKKRKLDSDSAEGGAASEEKELHSVVKQKELNTIMEEMNDLNKTKGQMVWLLKQVITAELMKKKKSKTEDK
eukprot:CAMPEP_0201687298 /NCGR_PEP_ID=MMETSP0578-20130828/1427_1 /ASSEMBLY_ACC=CAM_ASM_000663 /TAXON_ID=267565 /ORGANISM="Skeletonema grethea, Strain CCMP 1804" /LENGTH=277 /DNA_ID=CAMNT_0048171445 /DNA_START=41 /DNA_END=874 /DNA_ORIENTATION=+